MRVCLLLVNDGLGDPRGWGGGEGGRLFCFPSSLIMIIESTRMLFIMVIIIGIMAVLKTDAMIIKIK